LGTSLFAQEVQKDRKLFLGANFGVGLGQRQHKSSVPYTGTSDFIPFKGGIDIAYEDIEDISIGVYSAIGTDSRKEHQLFDLGALLLVGINESSSLILGAGAHSIDYKYNGGSFRLGVLTPRNVYLMLDATYNYYVRKDYYSPRNSTTTFSLLISFGYRIF
jgi:hypothetical protein